MTHTPVRLEPDRVSASTPVPRPREAQQIATAPCPRPDTPLASARPTEARAPCIAGLVMVVDGTLALPAATAAAWTDLLPADAAVVAAAAWPLLLLARGHYRRRSWDHSRAARVRTVLGTGVRAAVLALALSPWLTTADPVALAVLVAIFSLVSCVPPLLGPRRSRPRIVLAGRPWDVERALAELRAADRHEVVATCLTRPTSVSLGEVPAYVGFDSSPAVAAQHRADAFVLLPGTHLTSTDVRRLHWGLAGVRTELCVATGLLDVSPRRTRVFTSAGLNLVHVAPPSLRGPRHVVKDLAERAAATLGLVLLLPAMLVVAAVVRVDSPGPSLYRQVRVGRDGRRFTMYKFRSMSCSADVERLGLADANEADGVLFKIQRDPRITRVGEWLRRWSIDEVPQLWNVVRGDMSLVGPRPALPEEVALYDGEVTRRLAVKPGLTGLWQVSGRSDLTWAEAVRLDVAYVENWSLGLDAHILVRTFKAVLGRRGAY